MVAAYELDEMLRRKPTSSRCRMLGASRRWSCWLSKVLKKAAGFGQLPLEW